jgi:TonB family protein
MRNLRKLWPIAFYLCVPAWGQSPSASAQDDASKPQTTEPGKAPPDSNSKPLPDQASSAPGDSTKLEPIKTEKAVYPLRAQEKELQGQVWVKILVSTTGNVEKVEVISGDPILVQSAVDAVKKWKFKPFIKGGKPVPVSTKLPFNFAFSQNVHYEKAPPEDSSVAGDKPPGDGTAAKRVRVSAGVTTGLLLYKVQPVYPSEARQARIQGTVLLRAVIDKNGRIANLEVISGPKELAPAAIGAVQQWRYRPYLLMGDPVEVDTEIRVNFELR